MRMSGPWWYRAHGLTVRSDLPLPELPGVDGAAAPDLSIRLDAAAADMFEMASGDVRDQAPAAPGHTAVRALAGQGAGFRVDGVGTFWVDAGSGISIAPDDGADQDSLALFTFGSAFGLALVLRGALVLHAASILVDGQAVLFLGPSGAGKSTIAAWFARSGMSALGDDVVALWPSRDAGGFRVWPAARSFKIWQDALDAIGATPAGLRSVVDRADKYYFPNRRPAPDAGHRIGRIFVLEHSPDADGPTSEPLGLLPAVQGMAANVYRPEFTEQLGLQDDQFRALCSVAAQAPVARLCRPWDHGAHDSLVDLVRGICAGAAE